MTLQRVLRNQHVIDFTGNASHPQYPEIPLAGRRVTSRRRQMRTICGGAPDTRWIPHGGIKTRDSDQHNQQVTDSIHPAGPLYSLRFPIAATKAATSVRGTAVALGPVRGGRNYLLSAGLRRPAEPCHVTPIRPQADLRIARDDSTESRKVALRLISRGLTTTLESGVPKISWRLVQRRFAAAPK